MSNGEKLTAEQRMERKINLARERDTRVVVTRTIDTMRVLDVVRNADRGIRNLRNNLLIKWTPEEVIPLLEEYQKAVENLNGVAEKICVKAGLPYRHPRGLKAAEGAEAAKTDQATQAAAEPKQDTHGGKKKK